ncbi:MAG TPA: hypothetical protein VNK89_04005 [Thermoflexus sp.]|nr:hypothetical protein [Thermoflexus sp.]
MRRRRYLGLKSPLLSIALLLSAACAQRIPSSPTPTGSATMLPSPSPSPIPTESGVPTTPGIVEPVASPTHVASPGAPGLAILSFQADRAAIMPGEVFTLTWESAGAAQVWLYPLVGGRLTQGVPVSPTGSQIVTAPLDLRQPLEYMLLAFDQSGMYVSRSLRLPLRGCPEPWFFPNTLTECPSGPPVLSFAAYQPFERGHMIWIQARDEIFVLFADEQGHRWRVFVDLFEEGMPEYDPALTPPPGMVQPIRGFGLVWRNDPEVRARLGWALRPEQGFTTRIQTTARERYNILFIQAPDGGTWQLDPEGSGWSYSPPSG